MKRSTMINILQDSFIKNMNSEDVYSDEMMYSNILQDLEDSGMLPPFCSQIYYKVWRNGESGNKWEPE